MAFINLGQRDAGKAGYDLEKTAVAAEEAGKALKSIYESYLLPLEKTYKFNEFYQEKTLKEVDFFSKPIVLLVGSYSVGKSSFIKYLLQKDFPGMNIGQAPTTDRFVPVYYGETEQTVPGDLLQASPDLPFEETRKFGQDFTHMFQGSVCNAEILKTFTFIDTPGVLSGRKQRERSYDYDAVMEWFAKKATIILLLFDINKLDISDELENIILSLRKYDNKLKVVLNKSDSIDEEELIRDYGSLMWYLGKVFKTPEVLKVYITSFQDIDPTLHWHPMFNKEKRSLFQELQALPKVSFMQRKALLLKRARVLRFHINLLNHIRQQAPTGFFKKKTDDHIRRLLYDLAQLFRTVWAENETTDTDRPSPTTHFKQMLRSQSKYPKYSNKVRDALEETINNLLPRLEQTFNRRERGEIVEDAELNFFSPFLQDDLHESVSFDAGQTMYSHTGGSFISGNAPAINLPIMENKSVMGRISRPKSSRNKKNKAAMMAPLPMHGSNMGQQQQRARGGSVATAVKSAGTGFAARFKSVGRRKKKTGRKSLGGRSMTSGFSEVGFDDPI
eukprot:maker-scaffold_31-snap-gene-1.6-mRNA-1 protein AED:0.17 eAED:0.17 QI:394/1/1/1/0.8/0.66/6/127/558